MLAFIVVFLWWQRSRFYHAFVARRVGAARIDPRTNRPVGDHGSYSAALDFALGELDNDSAAGIDFLRAWRQGDLDEWPEFYAYLADGDY